MNGRSCSMNLHRTSGNSHRGLGWSVYNTSPSHSSPFGDSWPSPCGSTTSSAIGSLANSLHLKMPSGGRDGLPQSNMNESPIHLPALSPSRQVLTSGKPRFQWPPRLEACQGHTVKPKQPEFQPFPPNSGKGRIVFLGSFKSGHCCFSLPCLFSASNLWKIHDSVSGSKSHNAM